MADFAPAVGQPRGSERDSEDDSAFHLLLMDAAGKALACGRLHLTAPGEAQLRYMAVDERARGCGYGGRILEALEAEPRGRGAPKIVLNARDNAAELYRKQGYEVIGDAERLFWSDSTCANGKVTAINMPYVAVYIHTYALLGNHLSPILGREIGLDMDNLRRARLRAVTVVPSEVETSLAILC